MTSNFADDALNDAEIERLKAHLQKSYIPHLPPLLPNKQVKEEIDKKQLSRAFSAFVLSAICNIRPDVAAKAVVDDFNDGGVDAYYLSEADKTLYFVQGKLKAGAEFQQAEALKFTTGVKKLVSGDTTSFNKHVNDRIPLIDDELDACHEIVLVVAYVGNGLSAHAISDLSDLTSDEHQDEKRFVHPCYQFGPRQIRAALNAEMARPKINKRLKLLSCRQITQPRETWIGLIRLDDLVEIHKEYGDALFDLNLRNPLGGKSSVNDEIYASLAKDRDNFFYMNNGITALADKLSPKSARSGGQEIDARGLCIVNGAQTISTATLFKRNHPSINIDDAKVAITVISAGASSQFGKAVTRARNHQNAVLATDFAALDDDQERLRRELQARGIVYAYKAQDLDPIAVNPTITIQEAAFGLAALDNHPLNPWLLKTKPDTFRTPGRAEYERAFPRGIASERVVNAAYVGRALAQYIRNQIGAATNAEEREILKHAAFSHSWILMKRFRAAIDGPSVLSESKVASTLSVPADELRQLIIDVAGQKSTESGKRPWVLFRNQSHLFELLEAIIIASYNNSVAEAVAAKKAERPVRHNRRGRAVPVYDYPKPLFDYLCSRAPQIGNLV